MGIKILSASNAMSVARHSFLSHSSQTTPKHHVLFLAVVIAISSSVLSVDRCLRLWTGTGRTLNVSMWMLKIQNLSFVNCTFLRCGCLKVSKNTKRNVKVEGEIKQTVTNLLLMVNFKLSTKPRSVDCIVHVRSTRGDYTVIYQ